MDSIFHSPHECNKFVTHLPLPFSHKRFFLIFVRKLFLHAFSNRPYLSASSVAKICDVRITSDWGLLWYRLKWKSFKSIYLRSDLLETFLQQNFNRTRAKVLIIGGTDRNFNEFNFDFPSSIELILCQNNSCNTNNLFTMPLGLEDRELGRAGLKRYHSQAVAPKVFDKVFVPPMSPTNPVRRETILKCKVKGDIFDVYIQLMDENHYFRIARNYRFVMCLEGNGFENHRIWETLYRGGIPILLRSQWSETLSYLNLPIVLVDSVDDITKDFLRCKSDEFSNFDPGKCKELWTPYWVSVISRKTELGSKD